MYQNHKLLTALHQPSVYEKYKLTCEEIRIIEFVIKERK